MMEGRTGKIRGVLERLNVLVRTLDSQKGDIVQAMESAGDQLDLTQITMYPCVVPDRGVSDQTMNAAMAVLQQVDAGLDAAGRDGGTNGSDVVAQVRRAGSGDACKNAGGHYWVEGD